MRAAAVHGCMCSHRYYILRYIISMVQHTNFEGGWGAGPGPPSLMWKKKSLTWFSLIPSFSMLHAEQECVCWKDWPGSLKMKLVYHNYYSITIIIKDYMLTILFHISAGGMEGCRDCWVHGTVQCSAVLRARGFPAHLWYSYLGLGWDSQSGHPLGSSYQLANNHDSDNEQFMTC